MTTTPSRTERIKELQRSFARGGTLTKEEHDELREMLGFPVTWAPQHTHLTISEHDKGYTQVPRRNGSAPR